MIDESFKKAYISVTASSIISLDLILLSSHTYIHAIILTLSTTLFLGLRRCVGMAIIKYMLDSDFLEFLNTLLSFESNNMNLSDLFRQTYTGRVRLPGIYNDIAREYIILEEVVGSSRRAFSMLLKILPQCKFTRFLEGYIGIMDTTGNTLEYTRNYIDSELSTLENKLNGMINVVEVFYEAYLIILLSLIMMLAFPGVGSFYQITRFILSFIGVCGYIFATYISSKLYYDEPPAFMAASIFICLILPLMIDLLGPLYSMIITAFLALVIHLVWRLLNSWKRSVETYLTDLIEDLYMEAMQGFTVDHALLRLSRRGSPYSFIARELGKILALGLKGCMTSSLIRVSTLFEKVTSIVLAPIEVSHDHRRHLGYVIRFVRRINNIRRMVIDRSRVLFAYTLLLPPVVYVAAMALCYIRIPGAVGVDPTILMGNVLASSVAASIIMSKICTGSGFGDLKTLIALLENLILYLIASP